MNKRLIVKSSLAAFVALFGLAATAGQLRLAYGKFTTISTTPASTHADDRTAVLSANDVDTMLGFGLRDKKVNSLVFDNSNDYLFEMEFYGNGVTLGSEASRQFITSKTRFPSVAAGVTGTANQPTSNSTFLSKILVDDSGKEFMVVNGRINKGAAGKEYQQLGKFNLPAGTAGSFETFYANLVNGHDDAVVLLCFYTDFRDDATADATIDTVFVQKAGLTLVRDGSSDGYWVFCSDADLAAAATVTDQTWNYFDFICTVDLAYSANYTVTFVDYDGAELKVQEVAEGGSATAPADPSRAGFNFTGWDPADFSNVISNMTVTAQYEVAGNQHVVTFLDCDDSVVDAVAVADGDQVSAPADDPTREGHHFTGWLEDGVAYDFDTAVTNDITLVAGYAINTYTVTFKDWNGVTISAPVVEWNTAATEPELPAIPEGYFFVKWDRAFDCVTEDITVNAVIALLKQDIATFAEFVEYIRPDSPVETEYTLVNDIDLTDWVSCDFRGTLDGNGHSVTGLSTNALFATLYGTVRNLTISECNWTKSDGASFLAGTLKGAWVENCVLDGCSVSAYKTNTGIGGLALEALADDDGNGTVLTNCVARNCDFTYNASSGIIIGGLVRIARKGTLFVDCAFETDDAENVALGGRDVSVGGIVGDSICATLVRCRNNGRIMAGYVNGVSAAGGIAGRCASDKSSTASEPSVFIGCTNVADIVNVGADGGAGGIVGRAEKTNVRFEDCLNRGNIAMECYEGCTPVAAHANGCGVGGIIGGIYYSVDLSMSGCVNFGGVSDDYARSAGGLAGGVNSNIDGASLNLYATNCVNHGAVTGGYSAGGMFGAHTSVAYLDIINCGNTGDVNCPTGHVGGVCGLASALNMNNTKAFVLDGIQNVMNCGAVTTESGFAGGLLGTFIGSSERTYKENIVGNDYAIAPTNLVLTVSVSAGVDGTADDIVANIVNNGRTETVADAGTQLLAPGDFRNGTAKHALNGYAIANELPRWVQATEWPDLELFSHGVGGLMMLFK